MINHPLQINGLMTFLIALIYLLFSLKIGREVPELIGTNYREVVFGNYRIIYKIENEIKILTLRNSRQLLSSDNIEL